MIANNFNYFDDYQDLDNEVFFEDNEEESEPMIDSYLLDEDKWSDDDFDHLLEGEDDDFNEEEEDSYENDDYEEDDYEDDEEEEDDEDNEDY